jgi:hypothetical protein
LEENLNGVDLEKDIYSFGENTWSFFKELVGRERWREVNQISDISSEINVIYNRNFRDG